MSQEPLGELVPVGGGDAIPLMQEVMTIGRRQTCDIQLDFANISGTHAELSFRNGVWHIRDAGSTNGIKVNGERTLRRPLRPGDEISLAKRRYTIQYQLAPGTTLEDVFAEEEDVFGQSLMERAGLEKPKDRRDDRRR
ncbi:MAG: FHA domain-containing protein [Gemmataceae bacterium]|nr:FHA domain-containing protein [Gemmataceae bacterium]